MSNKTYKKRNQLEKLLLDPRVMSWRLALNTVESLYYHFENELMKSGCSYSRFQMLFHIYFSGPLSASQLSEKMLVSRGNTSSFVKRLLNDGLISPCKISSTATRPKFTLSREGEVVFERVLKIHLKHIKEVIKPLSSWTRQEISEWA